MFGRESVFDALLTRDLPVTEGPKADNLKRLQTTLRLVVNQMREGKKISTYIIHRLRLDMIRCGWEGAQTSMARCTCQEDSSELFLFLTSVFSAPFLPIEEVLFHGGAADKDDERVFTERILQLAVPEESPKAKRKSGVDVDKMGSGDIHLEDILMESFFSSKVKVERNLDGAGPGAGPLKISVDAWQANRMLPFFTPQNEVGDDVGADAGRFMSNNMVVPLLLKRYSYEKGTMKRIDRRVLIPPEIPFGLCVVKPNSKDAERISDYVLRLRSVVCHLGDDPRSGHYVTIIAPPDIPATTMTQLLASTHSEQSPSIQITPDPTSPTSSHPSSPPTSPPPSAQTPPSATSNPSTTSDIPTPPPTNTTWHRFDDMAPTRLQPFPNLPSIISLLEYASRNAYVCFYELVPSDNGGDTGGATESETSESDEDEGAGGSGGRREGKMRREASERADRRFSAELQAAEFGKRKGRRRRRDRLRARAEVCSVM
ncbi:hypothetical protein HDV00_011312 [Rhizophlyctis rosea]|nr:hypothetical protein HDV00_011312 [Rhizophlyctis rosea]